MKRRFEIEKCDGWPILVEIDGHDIVIQDIVHIDDNSICLTREEFEEIARRYKKITKKQ